MDAIPPNAVQYVPVVMAEIRQYWPTIVEPAFIFAQVEQETCPSLKHKKCWNPKTENINQKNNAEYGWGLGQLTNTNKYNNFEEVTHKYAGLKTWKWEDRFNPTYQIRTLIYMDKNSYQVFKNAEELNRFAFALSAYNGGLGGVLTDRKYCAQFKECDPEIWEGHVETHSRKARTNLGGYRISAYQINREYVYNIMNVRFQKYQAFIKNAETLSPKTSE